jgi:hypothetical protein
MTSVAEISQPRARPTLGTFERYLTLWVARSVSSPALCSAVSCPRRFKRSAA